VHGPGYGHLDLRSGEWSCMVRLGEPFLPVVGFSRKAVMVCDRLFV